MSRMPALAIGLLASSIAAPAAAAVLRVPQDHATIQQAVDAAAPGDDILVFPGRYCGAILGKPVNLVGIGQPTIMGCDSGPFLSGSIRIGFLLPGSAGSSAASHSAIAGFRFDGAGVSNTNLAPLAFGILGRFASDVKVAYNRFDGTVQPITNTAGDRWLVAHNRVEDLTVFDCTGFCTGGDGIVVQIARGDLATSGGSADPANRPENNLIIGNSIQGSVPDGFDSFGMVGILVFAADDTKVLHNEIGIPDNPTADAPGQGILITNVCCGDFTPLLPGARRTTVAFNGASRSEFGIVVEGSGGQNTEGLNLFHNRGSVVIEGVEQEQPPHRHFPHVRHHRNLWF